jgi:hypothetical protein
MFAGPRFGIYGYDVSADGKRFLVNDAGEAGVPRVALVVNWTAGLRSDARATRRSHMLT